MATMEARVDSRIAGVNLAVTDAQEKEALAYSKKFMADAQKAAEKAEEKYVIPTIIPVPGKVQPSKDDPQFGLYVINAIEGLRNREEDEEPTVIPFVMWLPFEDSSIDAVLKYFLYTYCKNDPKLLEQAMGLVVRRAIGQEMIVLRAKVKAAEKKGTTAGGRRGRLSSRAATQAA